MRSVTARVIKWDRGWVGVRWGRTGTWDIAETTGGLFFAARSDSDLEEVYERINEMETSEREDPRYRTVDRFEWPLGIGLLLMFLAVLFDALIVRRVP